MIIRQSKRQAKPKKQVYKKVYNPLTNNIKFDLLSIDQNTSWKNLNSLTSTLDFLPNHKIESSKKTNTKEEPSVSALFALFQKEINDIENENDTSISNEKPQTQSEEALIANLE